MDCFAFDNVKAEKADAMRRYNRARRFQNFMRIIEVLAALVLVSWSTIRLPVAAEMGADYFKQLSVAFNRPLFAFTALNAIIVVLFFLSSQKKPNFPDLYNEYVTNTTSSGFHSGVAPVNSPGEEEKSEEAATYHDKQIICVHNAESVSPVKKERVSAVSEAVNETEVKATVSSTDTKSDTYRRSHSERYEQRGSWREFCRSETAVGKAMVAVAREPERRSCAMDDLSSEEFRLTIETFIAAKKKSLILENRAG